jgi:hypothetical protein
MPRPRGTQHGDKYFLSASRPQLDLVDHHVPRTDTDRPILIIRNAFCLDLGPPRTLSGKQENETALRPERSQ